MPENAHEAGRGADVMKTGILTFHYAHHYGAQLQAYALMRAIGLLGADCEIINYVRADNIEASSLFRKGLSPRSVLSNLDTLMHYSKFRKRHERFNSFMRNEMKLSEKFYGSYEELVKDPPVYDIYVCGSDQIWNPLIFSEKNYDPAFFAEFAPGGRRVSYAPSFGISSIPEDKREQLAQMLAKFDHLSVREKQGEKIIREITGRDAVTVLDPTLLLTGDQWGSLAVPPVNSEPYILCYFITDARKYGQYVEAVSERYRLPVVSLCGSRRTVPQTSRKVLDAGPAEFLGLFKSASVVCTDSFHGTVFSINFKKEFYSFDSSNDPVKAVNSRQHNILDMTGLGTRLYSLADGIDGFRGLIGREAVAIDYTQADKILQRKREESFLYLKEALGLQPG